MPEDWSWPNFFRNAAIIAGAIALCVWLTIESILPNLVPKNFGVVTEGRVYRSGELTPGATRRVVREHAIRTIVDLGAHTLGTPEQAREEAVAEALGVAYHRLPLYGDGTGDPNQYARALRLMTDPDNQPVLVHCGAGAQRIGCAIALYRTVVEGHSPDDALREATDFRHDPEDNPVMHETFHAWRDDIERVYREGGLIAFDGSPRPDGGLVTQPLPPLPHPSFASSPSPTPSAPDPDAD